MYRGLGCSTPTPSTPVVYKTRPQSSSSPLNYHLYDNSTLSPVSSIFVSTTISRETRHSSSTIGSTPVPTFNPSL